MTRIFRVAFLMIFGLILWSDASAMVETKSYKSEQRRNLKATSFLDYPPFGNVYTYKSLPKLDTIYKQFIENYAQANNYDISYVINKPYPKLVMDILRGEIDVILGIYYDTKMYNGIEYIYPSILNNPMTVVMLPSRINEVKKMDDLKNLKGAMDSREHLADYVKTALKNYNIKYYDNSEKLYKQLFTGEVDYVFTSQYYGLIETSKLGIRNQVSFAKQSLWDMPLFIGISKTSHLRKPLRATLQKMIKDPQTKKQLEQYLIETINRIQRENIGVVPPAYTRAQPAERQPAAISDQTN